MVAKTQKQINDEQRAVVKELRAEVHNLIQEKIRLEAKIEALLEQDLRKNKPKKPKKPFFIKRFLWWLDARDGATGNLKAQYFWPALIVVGSVVYFLCHKFGL